IQERRRRLHHGAGTDIAPPGRAGLVDPSEGTATPGAIGASIVIIINPVSGINPGLETARDRAAMAAEFLAAAGGDPSNVFITERVGHARDLAQAAIARGASTIVAWGGDGTMNEVGSAAAFTSTAVALVPSGSGNGLARELGIPVDPPAALDIALNGRDYVIDAGEIDGRLFFNVAGIGLDARVAHRFGSAERVMRRGFSRYIRLTLQELLWGVPDEL